MKQALSIVGVVALINFFINVHHIFEIQKRPNVERVKDLVAIYAPYVKDKPLLQEKLDTIISKLEEIMVNEEILLDSVNTPNN